MTSKQSPQKPARWLIEAVRPVRFTYEGEAITLSPGERIRLPDRPARQLMARAGACIRAVDWLALWRDVAELSSGIEPEDSRLPELRDMLRYLDEAFARDSLADFLWGKERLKDMVAGLHHDV